MPKSQTIYENKTVRKLSKKLISFTLEFFTPHVVMIMFVVNAPNPCLKLGTIKLILISNKVLFVSPEITVCRGTPAILCRVSLNDCNFGMK